MANQNAIQDDNQFPALTGHSGTAGTAETRRIVVDSFGGAISTLDQEPNIRQAINQIYSSYGDVVSVESKKKSLLKFGSRSTVGTGWETLMTEQGTEVQETLLSTNGITTVVSSGTEDLSPLEYEYQTIATGNLTFGVGTVTLNGTTPVLLPTAGARVSRSYNEGTSPLVGTIYFYEGGTRTDVNTHCTIPAGEQQTQKAATSISSTDYWVVTEFSLAVSSFTTKFASARIEIRPVGTLFWRPITQEITITSDVGVSDIVFTPYRIVPPNTDVRIAVKTNSSGVAVKGGFNGYLASITV